MPPKPTTYEEFLHILADYNGKPFTDEDYYKLLVNFKDDILADIQTYNQGVVARKLKMHTSKLSLMLHILRLDIIILEIPTELEILDYAKERYSIIESSHDNIDFNSFSLGVKNGLYIFDRS